MNSNGERMGHGWFLKTSKKLNSWLVDPFQLYRAGDLLTAQRTNNRLLLFKERDYILNGLVVSQLRQFTEVEFSAVVSSTIAKDLDDEFTIANAQCFDLEFEQDKTKKRLIVFAKYVKMRLPQPNQLDTSIQCPTCSE